MMHEINRMFERAERDIAFRSFFTYDGNRGDYYESIPLTKLREIQNTLHSDVNLKVHKTMQDMSNLPLHYDGTLCTVPLDHVLRILRGNSKRSLWV